MFKIAAIFLATTACAGVLIAGPSVASKGPAPSPALTSVKVKTIAIHAPAHSHGSRPIAFFGDRPEGSDLLAGPATGGAHDA